jgi:hypothetical protein
MTHKKNPALLAAFIVLACGSVLAAAQKKDQVVGLHDTIVVSADETRDNVVTFGGNIIVEGKVRKSVLAFGGTITISGEVGEAVVGFGAHITLKATAVVKGDLVGLGGTIDKESGFRVDGDTVYFKGTELTSKIFKEGLKGIFSVSLWPIILIFKLINLVVWFLLALLGASLFPKQIAFASESFRKSFWPTFGIGFGALTLYTIALIIGTLLCLVLIGIPIVMGLAMGAVIVKVFGRVVLFYFFGESLSRALHKTKTTPLGVTLLGWLVVGVISFIPVFGFLFTSVLGILGWGIAIRTKFGSTENWFRRGTQPIQVQIQPPRT